MTRILLPANHGDQHLPTGSDPIPGLFSDLGFLHWGVNTDDDSLGLVLAADADVEITTNGNATTPGDIRLATAAYSIELSRFGRITIDGLNGTLIVGSSGGSAGLEFSGPTPISLTTAAAATLDAIGNVLIRSHNATHAGGSVTVHGDAGVTIEAPAGDVAVAVALKLLGATGATAAARFAGGTASGAPASGTFQTGDFVVDQSGAIWVCTAAGSPGTWASIGGGGGAPTGAAGGVLAGTYPNPDLAAGVAGSGLGLAGGTVLGVNVDGTTIEIASDALRVRSVPRIVEMKVISDSATLATGDGQLIFMVPQQLNGYNITAVAAFVSTVSSSGTPTIQIRNVTDAVDVLSTRITIDASEFTSYTAATPPVIDTSHDDVATGDLLAVDVDVAGTGAKGLGVVLVFELP